MKCGMEHPPKDTHAEAEPTPEGDFNHISSFGAFLEKRESAGLPGLSPEQFGRIIHATSKVFSVATRGGLLLAMALEMNQAGTRYDITETKGPDGPVYEHQDERTTEIMNYLTGEAPLPEDQKIFFYRQLLRNKYAAWGEVAPKDLDTFDIHQVEKHLSELNENLHRTPNPDLVKTQLRWAIPMHSQNPAVTSIAWKVQKDAGAPKIRWATAAETPIAKLMAGSAGKGRAFYDPINNTVYLTPGVGAEILIEEDAHAKQFNEKPLTSYARLTASWIETAIHSVREFRDLRTSYAQEYMQPGSLEWEAHKEIAPKIREDAIKEISDLDAKNHAK